MNDEFDRIFSNIDTDSDYYHSLERINDFEIVEGNLNKFNNIKEVLNKFSNGGVSPLECIAEINEIVECEVH